MDTIGSLIDKLMTVKLKISHTVRQGHESNEGVMNDLQQQRIKLTEEIDAAVGALISASKSGEQLDGGTFVQRKHKTYSGGGSK